MIIAIIVLLFFIYIAVAMYNFNSKSRRNHALAEAKSIYNAAITYQNDQYNNGKQYEFETAILNRTEERENNPLHKCICQYLFNADNYNYAIVCDEYGNVVSAFMSYYPISEKDLEYPKENKRTSFFYSTLISDKQDNITHYIVGSYPQLASGVDLSSMRE